VVSAVVIAFLVLVGRVCFLSAQLTARDTEILRMQERVNQSFQLIKSGTALVNAVLSAPAENKVDPSVLASVNQEGVLHYLQAFVYNTSKWSEFDPDQHFAALDPLSGAQIKFLNNTVRVMYDSFACDILNAYLRLRGFDDLTHEESGVACSTHRLCRQLKHYLNDSAALAELATPEYAPQRQFILEGSFAWLLHRPLHPQKKEVSDFVQSLFEKGRRHFFWTNANDTSLAPGASTRSMPWKQQLQFLQNSMLSRIESVRDFMTNSSHEFQSQLMGPASAGLRTVAAAGSLLSETVNMAQRVAIKTENALWTAAELVKLFFYTVIAVCVSLCVMHCVPARK